MGDAEPAAQVLLAVRLRDQGQDRVVVARAQDLEEVLVLEVPEQRSAVHDAVDRCWNSGSTGSRAGYRTERQVDPGQVLVAPEAARDAVQGEEDLLGLPALVVEELLEIAGG
jgi:hypothetical protein